tara:strand:- start:47 stop:352 length:306 start_codon:yes stop_codon:yes gene_type:complete
MKQTYQMYFGRNVPTGEYVTDELWDSFREVLGMTFSGYTVQDVEGAWKGETEDTKLVTVTTKYKDKVNDVCKAYVNLFNQDAVGLLVSEPMTFVTKEVEVF